MADVGAFLHDNLNRDIPDTSWVDALHVPWQVEAPNHGFHLRDGGAVVGAYLAYYSDQPFAGRLERVCNLGAWCVLEEYRFHGLRLLTTLLAQRGYHFTDFSPSGNVIPLNRRLKFTELDTTTALMLNLPFVLPASGIRVSDDLNVLERALTGDDLRIFRDHRNAAAARHVLIVSGHEQCYVVFRKDARKGLRLFASLLYVGNPTLLHRAAGHLGRYLLLRHRAVATLAELRIAGRRPPRSWTLGRSRPRMFRSATLQPADVSYLYSELTCLRW